jgi:hypothetical protein
MAHVPNAYEAPRNSSISQKISYVHKKMLESAHREFKDSLVMFAKQWKTSIQS